MSGSYLKECWYCDEMVVLNVPSLKNRIFHDECFDDYQKEKEKEKEEYVRLKIEVMYERSLRMLEKQEGVCLAEYKEAAEVVRDLARKDTNKFDSSHEMIAAMELINNRISTKVQYSVGRKKVDMLLPDLKVALEIDGHLHQFRIGKDSERDVEILNTLNERESGWEMVRIPTKFIEKNVSKLVPAIKAIHREKQSLRAKNGGFIPSYYSRHNLSAQLQALDGVKDKTKTTYEILEE